MNSHSHEPQHLQNSPQYLWFLMLSFTMVITLANWFDPRLVHIFGLDTDAGTLIFPLTFLLSDLITEVYGYKQARRAIWCGFLFNGIFILYSQLVIHLPSPNYPTNNAIFAELLSLNFRIIAASTLSYLTCEPLNAMVMAKLKISLQGRFMALRFISSTVLASGLDSFIFGFLAFYGTMSFNHLMALIFTMWFIKVFIEILGIPISIKCAQKLKTLEHMDIFDKNTRFNLFSLDAHYPQKNNQFVE